MSDGFSKPTHGYFTPARTVTEKYHDDLMHDWKVLDVAKDERIAELEAEVRAAHYEGYMAGVGDSEDYDHDPTVMEKEAWAEYEETE